MLARIPFARSRRFSTKYEGQHYLALRLIGEWCWLSLPGFDATKPLSLLSNTRSK
jgi:hypothetical protein